MGVWGGRLLWLSAQSMVVVALVDSLVRLQKATAHSPHIPPMRRR